MHPTADTLLLICGNLVGRRVMPGVRWLDQVTQNEASMEDDFKEILWVLLSPLLLGAIFFPFEYVFRFWLNKLLAFGLAAVITCLLSYALAHKVGISFSMWALITLVFAVVAVLGALGWLPNMSIPVPGI